MLNGLRRTKGLEAVPVGHGGPRQLHRLVVACLAGSLLACGLARAEDPDLRDLKARLETLEKRNQNLLERARQQTASAVNADPNSTGQLDSHTVENIVSDMLKKKDQAKKEQDAAKKVQEDTAKAADAAAKKEAGYEVGSSLGMSANWTPAGMVFTSENKDFQFHIGGRIDYDNVWWHEPIGLTGLAPGSPGIATFTPYPASSVGPKAFAVSAPTTPGIASAALGIRQFAGMYNGLQAPAVKPFQGPPATTEVGTTGEGQLVDGTFFRRARVQADGTAYHVMEWTVEYDFQNFNVVTFDVSFVGVRDLPFIGTLRSGLFHTPQGMESYVNSKFQSTMEYSGMFNALENQFTMGIYATNSILDQRVTWHYMFGRQTNGITAAPYDFGDGNYVHTARVTGLPIYLDDGRCLLHLGLSYQYKENPTDTSDTGAAGSGVGLPGTPLSPGAPPLFPQNVRVTRFRSQPGLRDSDGVGPGALGDAARFVDTGNIVASKTNTMGGELLAYAGPFWLQCEGMWANVPNAVYPPGTAFIPSVDPGKFNSVPLTYNRGNLNYWGYYLMAGYFLTGENRGYDRRFGIFDRVRPNENFFLVRGDDGAPQMGWGAWEVLYRWSFLDLDSKGADGGRLGEHTLGLNWYLNPNIRVMLNYVIDQRNYNTLVPAFDPGNHLILSNVRTGQTEGLGLRLHIDF